MKYNTIFLIYLIFASFCDNFHTVFVVYGHPSFTGLDKVAALSSVKGSGTWWTLSEGEAMHNI